MHLRKPALLHKRLFQSQQYPTRLIITEMLDAFPPHDCRSWQAGRSSSLTTAASEDSVDAASSVTEAASRLRDFAAAAAATVHFYVVLTRFELREDEAASGNSSWQMQAGFVRAH